MKRKVLVDVLDDVDERRSSGTSKSVAGAALRHADARDVQAPSLVACKLVDDRDVVDRSSGNVVDIFGDPCEHVLDKVVVVIVLVEAVCKVDKRGASSHMDAHEHAKTACA